MLPPRMEGGHLGCPSTGRRCFAAPPSHRGCGVASIRRVPPGPSPAPNDAWRRTRRRQAGEEGSRGFFQWGTNQKDPVAPLAATAGSFHTRDHYIYKIKSGFRQWPTSHWL
jgi:hypothetical protein